EQLHAKHAHPRCENRESGEDDRRRQDDSEPAQTGSGDPMHFPRAGLVNRAGAKGETACKRSQRIRDPSGKRPRHDQPHDCHLTGPLTNDCTRLYAILSATVTCVRVVGSALAIATFSAGVVVAIAAYREDLAARKPIEKHLRDFQVRERRPEVVTSVGYAPAADWAADIIADSANRDSYEPADLSNLTPERRAAWIRAMTFLSDELHSSRDLLLDAIRRRPGWPFHESLLGQVVFAADFRDANPELVSRSQRWSRPLLVAALAAPGATSVWQALAVAYVQTWPSIGSVHAPTSSLVFGNALADPDFVRVVFPTVAEVAGPDIATRDLPESAKPLLVASDYFAKKNEVDWAWSLRQRWERAEWVERVRDLDHIQRYWTRGDVDETRKACQRWLALHSVWDFDSRAAHAQALRVLTL